MNLWAQPDQGEAASARPLSACGGALVKWSGRAPWGPAGWLLEVSRAEIHRSLNMTQGMAWLQPGGILPLHHHEAPETYQFVSGRARVTIGDEVFIVGEGGDVPLGDLLQIPSNVPHQIENIFDKEVSLKYFFNLDFEEVHRQYRWIKKDRGVPEPIEWP
jgi:quercetin dioxygenase-like cupin family protein